MNLLNVTVPEQGLSLVSLSLLPAFLTDCTSLTSRWPTHPGQAGWPLNAAEPEHGHLPLAAS